MINIENVRYEDFIKIDSKFYPVFNKEVDENNPELWKSFIPHKGFLELLEKVIKAISRENPKEVKSIWLFGTYGTGKTHAVFVLKHLLEDKEEVIEDYLSRFHQFLYPYKDRIKNLRKQGVLVVYKSSAGYINSAIKLNLEIQHGIYESYSKRLKNMGLSYTIKNTDLHLLSAKLNEETINWEKFLEKNKSKLYYISSKEEIILRIDKGDIELASALIDCLIDEGIFIFTVNNVQWIKTWIEEILKEGYISKILFIWDEFTDFFNKDAPILTFQELVHLTQKIPFYLLIITHRPPDFWSDKLSEDFRKIKDRFITVHYTMENITIYKLISHILQIKDEEKWSELKSQILSNILKTSTINRLLEIDPNLSEEDIHKIFPLHPYSIYLMTKVVEFFGSTNRTLFDFFKSEKGFIQFLKKYPKNGDYLLTPDFLWDFFFLAQEELTSFYPKVKKSLRYYNSYVEKLDSEDEKRVFKTICLLLALKEEVVGVDKVELFIQPTLKTLKISYLGTHVYDKVEEILSNLEKNKIIKLYRNPYRREVEILEPSMDLDEEELEKYKKEFGDFSRFIKNYIKSEYFDVHRRLHINIVSEDEILRDKTFHFEEGYKIPGILIFRKEGSDIRNIKNQVETLSQSLNNVLFMISLEELEEERWRDILNEYAYYKYYEKIDKHQAEYHYKNFSELINGFLDKVKRGEFIVYIRYDDGSILERRCHTHHGIIGVLKNEVIPRIYPYSMEDRILSEPLWKPGSLRKQAISAALNPEKAQRAFDQLINMLVRDNFLTSTLEIIKESFNKEIDHPIIKLKTKIDEYLKKLGELPLSEVWNELKSPPFGFYEAPTGIFCFTFVLANRCMGYYAVNQLGEEVELDKTNLQRVIEETINARQNWIIRPLSKEEIEFCNLINQIFNTNVKTPREAIVKLREKVKDDFGYPIWMLNYSEFFRDPEVGKLIQCLNEIVINFMPEKSSLLRKSFQGLASVLEKMKDKKILFRNFKEAFSHPKHCLENFLNMHFYSEENRDIPMLTLDRKLRERLQEEPIYWQESKVIDLLNLMKKESMMMQVLSNILEVEGLYFIEDFIREINDQIKRGKLVPFWIYKSLYNDPTMIYLQDLFNLDLKFKDVVDKNLVEELHKRQSLIKDTLVELKEKKDEALQKWLREKFNLKEDTEILRELIIEFWNLTTKKPDLSEEEVLRSLKSKFEVIEKKVLKDQIRLKLRELIQENDLRSFLEKRRFPLALIKYLPDIYEFIENPDTFFNDLVRIDELSKESLKKILDNLIKCENTIKLLSQEKTLENLTKLFLGDEWDEDLFNEKDLSDFVNFYRNSVSSIYVSERELREIFNQWKQQRYEDDLMKLEEKIVQIKERDLKEIVLELIKDPEVGLKFIKAIKKMKK